MNPNQDDVDCLIERLLDAPNLTWEKVRDECDDDGITETFETRMGNTIVHAEYRSSEGGHHWGFHLLNARGVFLLGREYLELRAGTVADGDSGNENIKRLCETARAMVCQKALRDVLGAVDLES